MWQALKERLFGKKSREQGTGASIPGITEAGDAVLVTVECDRCGEEITVRLRKSSDIQRNYDEEGPEFFVRKTLVGKQCFNRIDLELDMDARYRPVDARVRGGKLRPKVDRS